jgi:hypothetical protein
MMYILKHEFSYNEVFLDFKQSMLTGRIANVQAYGRATRG